MNCLQGLYHTYAAKADFLCVYIAEAHAVDEWPMGEAVTLKQVSRVYMCMICSVLLP